METKVTEFEMMIHAILANATTTITNYTEKVNTQIDNMKKIIENLQKENKDLSDRLEKYETKPEKVKAGTPDV